MRAVLVRCDRGDSPWDFDSDERAALQKAVRLRYVRPARFAPSTSGYMRPAILAYALTDAGRMALDPLTACARIVVESYLDPVGVR